MAYTIVNSTSKAHQLKNAEGTVFWVQKRWLREDGSLTPAGINAERASEDRKAERDVNVEMPLSWENEHSVGIDYLAEFTLSSSVNAKPKRIRAFVSKKMVTIKDGTVSLPTWLEQKIRRESLAREQDRNGLHYGYTIVRAWGA